LGADDVMRPMRTSRRSKASRDNAVFLLQQPRQIR